MMTTRVSSSSVHFTGKTPEKYFKHLKDQRYIVLHNYLNVDFSLVSAKNSRQRANGVNVY